MVVAISEIRKQSSRFTLFEQECPVERASTRSSGNRPGARHVKAPPVFSGTTSEFKEWVFAMDFALKALAFEDAEERVDYVASFLEGNGRLWFIASQKASIRFLNWPPLRTKLEELYSPLHDKEQARIGLFLFNSVANLTVLSTNFLDSVFRYLSWMNTLEPYCSPRD